MRVGETHPPSAPERPVILAQLAPGAAEFDGINGFLGTRASIMLDVVFLAMFAIVPVLLLSIYLVRYRRKYNLHKRIQLALGIVLLVSVAAFEFDMQWLTVWEQRAEPSPYFETAHKWSCPAGISLAIHLAFAVPTAVLWVLVIVRALRNFPSPPVPGPHSRGHLFWGRLAAIGITMTAVTGWIFYWLAFVA